MFAKCHFIIEWCLADKILHRMHILLLLIAYDKKNETHSDAGASPCVSFMLMPSKLRLRSRTPRQKTTVYF